MSTTSFIGLQLTAADEITLTFKEWRTLMNGTGADSNMMKIDAAVKKLSDTTGAKADGFKWDSSTYTLSLTSNGTVISGASATIDLTDIKSAIDSANSAATKADVAASGANTAATNANTARTNTESATNAANTAASKANTAADRVDTAIQNAETATDNANDAATAANNAATSVTFLTFDIDTSDGYLYINNPEQLDNISFEVADGYLEVVT